MATQIEEMFVKISADVDDLRKGMAEARESVKSSSKKINSDVNILTSSFMRWGLAIMGARRALREVTQALARMDQIAKQATSISMSTKALGGMQHAAALAGVNVQQLSISLNSMVRNLGLAAMGTGEAKVALKNMGLNLKELLRMSPSQQFEAIADGLKKLGTSTERSAAATRIFGESGQRMMVMLEQGADGLRRSRKEAERYGLALDEIDLRKIENTTDAVTRMEAEWAGFVNKMVVEYSPEIIGAIDLITDAGLHLSKIYKGIQFVFTEVGQIGILIAGEISHYFHTMTNAITDGLNVLIEGYNAVATRLGQGTISRLVTQDLEKIGDSFVTARALMMIKGTDLLKEIGAINDELQTRQDERDEERLDRMIEAANRKAQILREEVQGHKDADDAKTTATEAGSKTRQRLAERAASSIIGNLRTIVNASGADAEQQLRMTKALGIAEAIVNTATAVTNIIREYGGRPAMQATLVSLAVAAGAAQIATIRATELEGGGSVSGGSAASSAAAGAAQEDAQRVTNVTVVGDQFGPEHFRHLIEGINDAQEDGTRINLVS